MASHHPIEPFPPDIERDAFGHYLSGFTDGKGTFGLKTHSAAGTVIPGALFGITLRGDDLGILRLIQSYWGCGAIDRRVMHGQPGRGIIYRVTAAWQLASIVVPHFDKYPLRAKKRRDFLVWREAVELLANTVYLRRRTRVGERQPARWTPDRLERLVLLKRVLEAGRVYDTPGVPIPPPPPPERTLFDLPDSQTPTAH